MAGDIEVEVDPAEFRNLMAQIKEFDPKLSAALRKRLRLIGGDIVDAMQSELRKPPPSGGRSRGQHHSRKEAAEGLKVMIQAGKRKQGVAVVGSKNKMAAGREAFPRMYNQKKFRHPVFPGRSKRVTRWVWQQGNPYFGSVIKRFEERAEEDIMAALQEAVDTIKGG